MDVWQAIQSKRAVRKYTSDPLPEDAIQRILNAGRRAQSSKNTQPWHFIVVRDRDRMTRLAALGTYLQHVPDAAMLVCIATRSVEPERANWVSFDVGQCAAYMQLAAQELGIGSVVGRFHQWRDVPAVLHLPDDMRCDVVIAFGYPAPEEQARPRNPAGRRPLDDIVHRETW